MSNPKVIVSDETMEKAIVRTFKQGKPCVIGSVDCAYGLDEKPDPMAPHCAIGHLLVQFPDAYAQDWDSVAGVQSLHIDWEFRDEWTMELLTEIQVAHDEAIEAPEWRFDFLRMLPEMAQELVNHS